MGKGIGWHIYRDYSHYDCCVDYGKAAGVSGKPKKSEDEKRLP